jgi:glycerol-3-phosphate dehydrogenase (NAD(P)+)
MSKQTIGIIGSGSWATAIAKIVTDNGNAINWWVRKAENIHYFQKRHHNPQYLRNAYFDVSKIEFSEDVKKVVAASDIIVIAVPSIYVENSLLGLDANLLKGKKVVSAVKGVIPKLNILLNQYLAEKFEFPLGDYYTLLGPSHAEEVASEQLSYLTFSGINIENTNQIAGYFKNEYINTIVNDDIVLIPT